MSFENTSPDATPSGAMPPDGLPAAAPAPPPATAAQAKTPFGRRLARELLSWLWIALAFLLITGTSSGAGAVVPRARWKARCSSATIS